MATMHSVVITTDDVKIVYFYVCIRHEYHKHDSCHFIM